MIIYLSYTGQDIHHLEVIITRSRSALQLGETVNGVKHQSLDGFFLHRLVLYSHQVTQKFIFMIYCVMLFSGIYFRIKKILIVNVAEQPSNNHIPLKKSSIAKISSAKYDFLKVQIAKINSVKLSSRNRLPQLILQNLFS